MRNLKLSTDELLALIIAAQKVDIKALKAENAALLAELGALLAKMGAGDTEEVQEGIYPYTLAERIQVLDDMRKDDMECAAAAYEQIQAATAALIAELARTSVELKEAKSAREEAEESLQNWVAFDKSTIDYRRRKKGEN